MLPFKLKGLPVFLLLGIAIFYFTKNKFVNFSLNYFLFLSSLFIINIFSLLNTFSFPIKNIETIISLILIPLAFAFLNGFITEKQKTIFTLSFICASFTLAISHLIYFFSTDLFSEGSLKVNSFRKAVVEIPVLSEHPIYISFFLSIALLFLVSFSWNKDVKSQIFLFICSLIITIDLFLISSKGVILALFFAILIYLFNLIKTSKVKIISLSLFVSFFIISILYFPTLERRFRELSTHSTYTKVDSNNSSSIRFGIYKCVVNTIIEKPFLGYGFGTVAQSKCYENTSEHLFVSNYNSHNQYLGYMLNAGAFGIITILFFIFYLMRFSYVHKDYLLLSLMIFFSIVMLTENILERQSGVILFIFIVSLFFYCNIAEDKKITG